ncbi:NAD-dependent epimerase/dehydratase family protein [Curtobacterium aurantiacum]|uniref:NAD-dependent epimerase/dehydratase family protein n=1 Tax=Curtobacterium aurantiacum TaxID=3236919 RepID=A0ABS5VC84_9MICO|nr:NAD-dependent epimerase/dehydratase family protein [Curtobacterium flaccumfaciens]MBT1545058.1 NAD-dependent epimerase/dehydratase family protein [Curtobacterium flaccumfaciens pv. flaccumfaciens]MBT1587047.1 NAD-dependent epimerase/dehydratase family protein [Curtobacterium flaccumfaciens pv. flaccumfaciens]
MRRVLVLGGTGWLGRAIVGELLAEGADVSCVARGTTGSVPEGARFIQADRSLPGAYEPATGDWDEVIELAHAPGLVAPALDALADRAAHWTLVSTVSVYAENDEPGADESARLVEPTDPSAFADAKVLAERATRLRLGSRLCIARPGLIAGPGDPSDRFGYWPARFDRGGPVLVPTTAERFVQVIDVADLAAWLVRAGRDGFVGTVNAVGAPIRMREFFRCVAEVTGFDDELVAAEDDVLLAHDVAYWAGPTSLPLWIPVSEGGFAQRSTLAFADAGGVTRPLRDTVVRMLEDERARGTDRERRAGLTAAAERAVLATVR